MAAIRCWRALEKGLRREKQNWPTERELDFIEIPSRELVPFDGISRRTNESSKESSKILSELKLSGFLRDGKVTRLVNNLDYYVEQLHRIIYIKKAAIWFLGLQSIVALRKAIKTIQIRELILCESTFAKVYNNSLIYL